MQDKKLILITGGSRGIGAALAKISAKSGYRVIITYAHNQAAASEVVSHIHREGGQCSAIKADVSLEGDVIKLFHQIKEEYGRIDCLVNNAGISGVKEKVENMSAERLLNTFSVNVVGSFLCAREAIKMMRGKGGSIVNLSSAASRLGSPFEYVDYASSKGAIDTFTLGLSKEVAEDNIRVNAVRPGLIHTGFHALSGDAGRVDKLKGSVPMKRGGTPEEVAKTVLWLCSDEASYVTGALVDVAGGR